MKQLLKKTKLVKQILQEVPETRCNDGILLIEYYKRVGVSPEVSFEVLVHLGYFKDIESVTRVRRKLQEKFPDLRDLKYYELRRKMEPEYIEYALETTEDTTEL